jgi:hypothetical protein
MTLAVYMTVFRGKIYLVISGGEGEYQKKRKPKPVCCIKTVLKETKKRD